MKNQVTKRILAAVLAAMTVFTVSCATPDDGKKLGSPSGEESRTKDLAGSGSNSVPGGSSSGTIDSQTQSFAEAHDAFQTTLAQQNNDSDYIPVPPEGYFDLVSYPSKIGDMAAYVSSDPGDGEKHPIIIWVVGGWGNGIDDFPWCYPTWDNDQTGSAFWQSGILTMYPSFRGGNGNPGYYETLFGEVDDIVSACEYAASLPYVDPDRIYLGGHSTGGTRALLAAEYSDMFRAVFCFGAVDEIKYHNNTQFTFDTNNEDEYIMRSPIYWLDSVKNPVFLIEGRDGNSANLERIRDASSNDNINCYILEGEDHFSALGPVTWLLAEKILADTGEECNISVTQEELEEALKQDPIIPAPIMYEYSFDLDGAVLNFSCPYLWEGSPVSEESTNQLYFASPYEDDNVWDMLVMYLEVYGIEDGASYLSQAEEALKTSGYDVEKITKDGMEILDSQGKSQQDDSTYNNRYVIVIKDGVGAEFDLYLHEGYGSDADSLIQSIVDSISLQ